MMKKIFVLLIILPISIFAQEIEVKFGNVHKDPSKTTLTKLLGQDNDAVYALRRSGGLFKKRTLAIEAYNNDLNITYSKEFDLPDEDMVVESIFMRYDTVYAFLSLFNKDENINYLYGTTVSKDGAISSSMAELAAVQVEGKRNLNSFGVFESSDSSKFLVSIVPAYNKKEERKVQFIVLDHQFRSYDQVRIDFPFKQQDFSIKSLKLSSTGDIHLMASVKSENENAKKRERELRIFTYFREKEELHEYKIDIGKNYISEYKLKVNRTGNIILTGFYSDFSSATMKGIYFLEIDPKTRQFIHNKTTEFTSDFLQQFMSQRRAEKGKSLWNYEVRDIFQKEDGGYQFLSEYYHFYITQTTDANGRTTTTYHYNYGHVIVADFKEDGTINWWTKIPKLQYTKNDGGTYSGMSYSFRNNKIYLIYNEHEKNINEIDPDRLRNINKKKSWAVLVTVASDGMVEKTPLFEARDKKTLLKPRFSIKSSEKDQILVSEIGKMYRLVRVSFN
jgi:hypothetical protein